MKHKIFEIGGCVRDELLGLHTKDIDFTVVIDQQDEKLSVDEGWAFMKHFLLGEGFKIFLETKTNPPVAGYTFRPLEYYFYSTCFFKAGYIGLPNLIHKLEKADLNFGV